MLNKLFIHSQEIARKIDQCAINEYHIPSLVLMEQAAAECCRIIQNKEDPSKKICVLCGQGNNGADGLAIARLLAHEGYEVSIYLPYHKTLSQESKVQFQIICSLAIPYTDDLDTIRFYINQSDILIDCLFGNGLSRDIEGSYKQLIDMANASNKKIYAIDIPSGIHATSGKILNCAIHADTTIALDCFKEGHWIYPGKEYCGNLLLADIKIPTSLHLENEHAQLINEELIKEILPKRDDHSHKGSFGKALMIGGSKAMPGAFAIAAKACAASGIGTLTLMEPDCIGDLMAMKMDFAMHLRANDRDGHFALSAVDLLKQNMDQYDLISIGNGMQRNEITIEMVKTLLSSNKTVILDADALWTMQDHLEWLNRNAPTILTPHVKEMTFLTNKTVQEILESPFSTVREFTNKYFNCILILKSDITYIGSKNDFYVLSRPNSALAKGGSGDLLCGILTGILGHKISPSKGAACAAYLHSKSAEINKDPASINSEDIIKELAFVLQKLRKD